MRKSIWIIVSTLLAVAISADQITFTLFILSSAGLLSVRRLLTRRSFLARPFFQSLEKRAADFSESGNSFSNGWTERMKKMFSLPEHFMNPRPWNPPRPSATPPLEGIVNMCASKFPSTGGVAEVTGTCFVPVADLRLPSIGGVAEGRGWFSLCKFLVFEVGILFGTIAMGGPNIVVIYTDDQGIGDVGAYGCSDIPTPHMDSIAENGVLCEQGYVTCPQCGPSRAGLLTGRYQQTFGYEFNCPIKHSFEYGLPLSEQVIFSRMKAAGYRTGVVGKWHMGRGEGFRPWERDVETFYGVLNGTSWYFPPFDWASKHLELGDPTDIHRNSEIYMETEADYITDAFAREAADFIERNKEVPFFLYVPFTAPHVPIQYRPRHIERVAHIQDEKRREYAAMVVALDDAVGQILQTLQENGLWNNTLLFFSSDNGAAAKSGGSNGIFSGWKGSHEEGGIRVPYLVQWPGTLPAGTRFGRPVSTLDVAATAVAVAGEKAAGGQRLDGVNLIPFLTGKQSGDPHEYLYYKMFAWADVRGIRHGDWMLFGNSPDKMRLYNIAEDPRQKNNLIARYPELVSQLTAEWERWNKTTVPTPWNWKE